MFAVQETSTASSQVVPKHSEDAGFKIPVEEPDEWLPIKLASRGLLFTLSQLSQRGRVQTFVGAVIATASLLFLVTKCFSLISPVLESSRGVASRLLSLAERGSLAGGKCRPEYLRVADAPGRSATGTSARPRNASQTNRFANKSSHDTRNKSPFSLLLRRPVSNVGIERLDVGAVIRQLDVLQLSKEDKKSLSPDIQAAVLVAKEIVEEKLKKFKALRREYAVTQAEVERLKELLNGYPPRTESAYRKARNRDASKALAAALANKQLVEKDLVHSGKALKCVLSSTEQRALMLILVAKSRKEALRISFQAAAALSIALSLTNPNYQAPTAEDQLVILDMVEESLSKINSSLDALRPLVKAQPFLLRVVRRRVGKRKIAEAREVVREAENVVRGLRALVSTFVHVQPAPELEAAVQDLNRLILQLHD